MAALEAWMGTSGDHHVKRLAQGRGTCLILVEKGAESRLPGLMEKGARSPGLPV